MHFLDKLEHLLIHSDNITYFLLSEDEDISGNKDTVYIGAGSVDHNNHMTHTYVKEFMKCLTLSSEDCLYSFIVNFFSKDKENHSLMEKILTLSPSDEDLLLLYQQLQLQEEEIPGFLSLFKEKTSFIKALKMGNIRTFYIENDKEFLEKCFNDAKHFQLSTEDYYDIFTNYIKKSRIIHKKDRLFELFITCVDDNILLENLFETLYHAKINIANGLTTKTVEKIDMNSLGLMKHYKFISSDDLDKLLSFFVNAITQNINSFSSTTAVQYFKSVKNFSNFTEYSLIVETNNIKECSDLLDVYLKYFVEFNKGAGDFIANLNSNPQIFQNFMLYKKLDNKLEIQNTKNKIKKI